MAGPIGHTAAVHTHKKDGQTRKGPTRACTDRAW